VAPLPRFPSVGSRTDHLIAEDNVPFSAIFADYLRQRGSDQKRAFPLVE
jgi:hypothetical protein